MHRCLSGPTRSSARQSAFTLIELLVVISIIALLISILLPALKKTREAGKSIACSSNERQLSIAYEMFSSDHDGQLLETKFDPNNTWFNHQLPPYLGVPQTSLFNSTEHAGSFFYCPASSEEDYGFYATNYATNGWTYWFLENVTRDIFKQPSVQMSFIDAFNQFYVVPDLSIAERLLKAVRHEGRSNVSYFDGHVSNIEGDVEGGGAWLWAINRFTSLTGKTEQVAWVGPNGKPWP